MREKCNTRCFFDIRLCNRYYISGRRQLRFDQWRCFCLASYAAPLITNRGATIQKRTSFIWLLLSGVGLIIGPVIIARGKKVADVQAYLVERLWGYSFVYSHATNTQKVAARTVSPSSNTWGCWSIVLKIYVSICPPGRGLLYPM